MSIDDTEEDCTVYIEELKSDNPTLKLNAASKISAIANVLGTCWSTQDTTACGTNSYRT